MVKIYLYYTLKMTVNKKWIEENYIKFNHCYFNDLLPPIGVGRMHIQLLDINKPVNYLGRAQWHLTSPNGCDNICNREYSIKINNYYSDLYEVEFQNVLLHEMIHIWQYIMGYKGGHGTSFKKKAKEINEFGWGITSKYEDKYIKGNKK